MFRDTQPVKQALQGVSGEQDLEIRLLGTGAVEQPRPDRGTHIATVSRHATPWPRCKVALQTRLALAWRNATAHPECNAVAAGLHAAPPSRHPRRPYCGIESNRRSF